MEHPDDVWPRERSLIEIQLGLDVPADDPFFTVRRDPNAPFDEPLPMPAELRARLTVPVERLAVGENMVLELTPRVEARLFQDSHLVARWPCGDLSVHTQSHFAVVGDTLWAIELVPDPGPYKTVNYLVGYDWRTGARRGGPWCRWASDVLYQPESDSFFVRRMQPRRAPSDYCFFTDNVEIDAKTGTFRVRPSYRIAHVVDSFDEE